MTFSEFLATEKRNGNFEHAVLSATIKEYRLLEQLLELAYHVGYVRGYVHGTTAMEAERTE